MRILVVEDSELHRRSAIKTLEGHELTIAANYKQAVNCLGGATANEYERQEKGDPYDVLLTDMMIGSGETNDEGTHAFGFVLALIAALRGVKHIALLTDINHHHAGPSQALDAIGPAYYRCPGEFAPNFEINGAKAMFVHAPVRTFETLKNQPCENCVDLVAVRYSTCDYPPSWKPGECRYCKGTAFLEDDEEREVCPACKADPGKCSDCKGTGVADRNLVGKDWGMVLKDLLGTLPTDEV
ncbi:hypothetical protein A3A71_00895 [Candidatus Berkelbacteria bacterium RIFCSPLOWO2_01_FULL_50_28]|uniref:Response regulatory domain-containing protein n=1 Tax=Candidatus Berkelbacteria bacterium RIFCSPLOWO2_01_FULL_50_28 TaxID=1797471 RepID=A0A1F5EB15_9BACT|nr:MAG: hypothetical protein A2807_01465 [Candidatus Berkelbacteria bacterium RIFCSPHIGHO2_01_FULL_50_36]OGD62107.1 MAG: hypothetical protein A3F39_03120 [Candidatus Berkelbacteria bacterium RIFCSPHIGHO2_12_FULL_50_11]OGD64598.1 MAG: hypothetical protein A3A71_00895 [Candidatus Berkelbacteria bacterium RIFCSPLOWO2_01_FULL_50_28]